MKMRRCHIIQIAKEQQRIENKKKTEDKPKKKKSILARLIGLKQ
tara:strand:- start:1974 stop:2105 length:132 start_codon:yes stop_codon:yes gene_type:complete